MIKRISIISTAVLAALLIAGLARATPDDSPSSTTSMTLGHSATAALQAEAGSRTYEAGAAGRVTVDQSGASLSVASVAANTGWVPEVEMASGREVEVKFVNGTERIDFQAELEDGLIKTRVTVRALDGSTDDGSDDENLLLTAPSGSLSFAAGDAGTVQLRASDGSLELISATPGPGWTVADIEIEGSREINVEFSNGSVEIEFKAEMEDGLVKTRVRTEMNDDSSDDSGKDQSNDDSNGDNSGRSHEEDDSDDDEAGSNSLDD